MRGAGKLKRPLKKPVKMWPRSSVLTHAKSCGLQARPNPTTSPSKARRIFTSHKGKHLITVKTEHKAVLDTMRELERQGFEVTYLDVQEDGMLNMDVLKAAIRPDTILISVMHVNNEIGVMQDIAGIGAMCREKGIMFHVDAAQSTGKVEIDLATLPVDLMSLASHKTYGPKGIGALYVRRKPRVRLEAQMHGGGHERGMRSGTLPTHQCVGMGEAFRLAKLDMAQRLGQSQSACKSVCSMVSKTWSKCSSTATWNTACRTT